MHSLCLVALDKVPTNALRFTSMIGRPGRDITSLISYEMYILSKRCLSVEILQAVWYGIDIVEAT